MKLYEEIKNNTPKSFLRTTGISLNNFLSLCCKVETQIEKEKEKTPIKKRGLKKYKISQQDCVLLTLYYLRHYITFQNLGHIFDISESYCYKIYSRYARILAKVVKLPNRKHMINEVKETLIIDVSEQPIERPVSNQKEYYSGKKKDIRLRHN